MPDDAFIRTTHVGSLPRPAALRELLKREDPTEADVFDTTVTEAVRDVVRRQHGAGIDIANNGEQARLAYSVDVTNRLSGYGDRFAERDLPADLDDFPEFAEDLLGDIENIGGPVASGPIVYTGGDALRRELERFDDAVRTQDVSFEERFHTAPSPGAVLRFTESDYHDSEQEYLFDLAEALQEEYRIIAEHGLTLQIDAPELLAGYTITYKDADTDAFREHVRTYIDALNRALKHVPAEQVRLHACWGNYPGPHHHDVALRDVVDIFYDADISTLIIEGANPRHQHEYRAFEDHPLPPDWSLVPGVIDVKTNIVEHPEAIADRIERVAETVGDSSRVIAGCDCGFETVLSANFVHPGIAWKKLEALSEGAEIASQRLF